MSFLIEFSLEFVSVVKVFTPEVIRVVDRDKMKYLTIIICSLFVDHGSFLVLFLEYIPMCILVLFGVLRFCFHTVGTRQFTLFYIYWANCGFYVFSLLTSCLVRFLDLPGRDIIDFVGFSRHHIWFPAFEVAATGHWGNNREQLLSNFSGMCPFSSARIRDLSTWNHNLLLLKNMCLLTKFL